MFYVFCFIIFLFGLCLGSFLNSVIYRLKTGESILISRSHCPFCKHVLGFWDLIPLFSFLFLGGKCRYCKKKISWQYPMVELACGILFVLTFLKSYSVFSIQYSVLDILSLAFQFFFVSILIVIFVYDLKWSIISDQIIGLGIVVALVSLFIPYSQFTIQNSLFYLLAAGAAAGFFLFLVLVSREKWMGWGDVKLGLLMGLILGWPNILMALFLAYISGALVGVGLILAKKKTLKSEIPFGPFLCGATIVAMLVGGWILNWYLGILG